MTWILSFLRPAAIREIDRHAAEIKRGHLNGQQIRDAIAAQRARMTSILARGL